MTELTPALPKLLNRQELVTDIRLLISERWGLAVEYITLKSNFCDDLGLDCLEITELAVLIEQRFPYLAVSDDGPLVSLDDLIRSIQLRDGAANSHDLGYTEPIRAFVT